MNNKEKYIKYKKRNKVFLSLGTTIGFIGIACCFSNLLIGILLTILGLIFVFLSYYFKNEIKKIEKYCLENCILCNKNINKTNEIKYYYGNSLVDYETFNNFKDNKIKKEIFYYKCSECHLCMTLIKSYLIVNGKEKPLNDVVNIDFNYENDY